MIPRPKAVFFDRDGTLIFDGDYMSEPSQIKVVSGAAKTLSKLRRAGVLVFLLTNQSAVSRGYFSAETAWKFHDAFIEKLGAGDNPFDGVCMAFEIESSADGYRKPSPKYVFECSQKYRFAPSDAVVVGDRISDWATAVNAGASAVAVRTGKPIGAGETAFFAEHGVSVIDSVMGLPKFFGL